MAIYEFQEEHQNILALLRIGQEAPSVYQKKNGNYCIAVVDPSDGKIEYETLLPIETIKTIFMIEGKNFTI